MINLQIKSLASVELLFIETVVRQELLKSCVIKASIWLIESFDLRNILKAFNQ